MKAKDAVVTKDLPEVSNVEIPVVYAPQADKNLPPIGNPENIVIIDGKPIEIKATKVRYQRDRTASFYKAIELYPLADILSTDVGVFDEERNGDKCVMDWLIAVTNDPALIITNYNQLDTDIIEKMLMIFKRVNRIEEKEQKTKNLQKEREGEKRA